MMPTHFPDGILDANYEFDITFRLWRNFEVARCTYGVIFCYISLSLRIVGITPNDTDYMISYLSSMHYVVVSPSEKD